MEQYKLNNLADILLVTRDGRRRTLARDDDSVVVACSGVERRRTS
ncbi:hypothetical protein [Nocardioides houyundeii]|nr:hypothetical protein [Nocardioides houyundeii]